MKIKNKKFKLTSLVLASIMVVTPLCATEYSGDLKTAELGRSNNSLLEEIDTYNKFENITEYNVVDTEETDYGTVYYVYRDSSQGLVNDYSTNTFWDVVDIVMAGASWADLFKDPSWKNFGWAILDTGALLPLLPSTAYVRKGNKAIVKLDELAKFFKTSKGKTAIEAAMKTYKYSDGITPKAIKQMKKYFKTEKEQKEVLETFKKIADRGLVGGTNQRGIKKLTGNSFKPYTHEIKDTGKYVKYRFLGYKRKDGSWVFDAFEQTHK